MNTEPGTLPPEPPTTRQLTRFFMPLAIQAVSQSLSYPLVAMVASRGAGGPLNLARLAQSNTVMFFIGMIAISSVTTGMVYAKTREGYEKFRLVTLATGLAVIAVQAVLCIPTVSHLLNFDTLPELIGPIALTFGSLASSATMRPALNRAKERAFPVGQTTTSVGQIR